MAFIKISFIILINISVASITFAEVVLDETAFVEEPEDSLIVDNKPVTLTCKAKGSSRVWFQCDSISPEEIAKRAHGQYYVEPETGRRMAESSLELTRVDVDNYKANFLTNSSNDQLECYCQAMGTMTIITSQKASVGISQDRRIVKIEPILNRVEIGSKVNFTCIPSSDYSDPKIYWLKNGKIIKLKQSLETNSLIIGSKFKSSLALDAISMTNVDFGKKYFKNDTRLSNYFVTKNGTLLIKSVTLADSANFSCAVVYKLHSLKSATAQLIVFANGGWSEWSSWSNCSVACGIGIQKRIRHCNNPPAVNGGKSCIGNTTQIQNCINICNPINGRWSSWSSWTPCSSDCQQSRKRFCNNPPPLHGGQFCLGSDLNKKNCTGGLCRKSDNIRKREKVLESTLTRSKDDQSYDLFLIGIVIMATALLCFGIFLFLVMRHRRYKYQSPVDPRYSDGNQALLMMMQQGLQQTPDLIRNNNGKLQLISRQNNANTNLIDHYTVRDENVIYNRPSLETCLNTSNNHSLSTSATTIISAPKVINTSSSAPSRVTPVSVTSEDDNESEPDYAEPMISNVSYYTPERKPPLPSTCPPGTRFESSFTNNRLLKFIEVTKDMSNKGYFYYASEMSIGVYIPPNSLNISSSLSSTLYFGLDNKTKISGLTTLSPIFVLGSDQLIEFNQPIVIIVKHCLTFNKSGILRCLSILWTKENVHSKSTHINKWTEILRYGQENLNTCFYTNIDENYLYLMTNVTGKFVLSLTKEDGDDWYLNQKFSKQIGFSCSSEPFSSTENLVRVYIYDDLLVSKINLTNETNSNNLMAASSLNTKFNLLYNNCPLSIEIIKPGEKVIKGMSKVEVPLNHLWNCGPNSILHCSFITLSNSKQSMNPEWKDYQIKISQNDSDGKKLSQVITFNCKSSDKSVNQNDHPQILVNTYGSKAIDYRLKLASKLNLPRSDFKDWRGLASLCELTHYLPYFASRHNPTSHLLDLWEAKIINNLIINHCSQPLIDYRYLKNGLTQPFELEKVNEVIRMRLIQILYNLERNDLVSNVFKDYHR